MIDLRLGDCLEILPTMPAESVHCCVTSPPYFGLRDYGADGQIGLERTPDEYVAKMVAVFREVRRLLRADGTLWLNLGDSYSSSPSNQNMTGHRNVGQRPGKLAGTHKNCKAHATVGRQDRSAWGLEPKQLIGIPWRVAFALQADGWYLRSDIIWHKPNPMPESVRDRPTKAHEYLFLLSRSERYHYDADAIREQALARNAHDLTGQGYAAPGQSPHSGNRGKTWADSKALGHRGNTTALIQSGVAIPSLARHPAGRNRRSVWTITPKPFKGAHFATFPPKLIEPCILAGCPAGGTVLDPFSGAGTTGLVAQQHGRGYVGIELNSAYMRIAEERIESARFENTHPLLAAL